MELTELEKQSPLLKEVEAAKEVFWLNPNLDNQLSTEVSDEEMAEAAARLERFAPYIEKVFPETKSAGGIIESPLKEISTMRDFLLKNENLESKSRLFLKCDSDLPISGSIKARGGIYEVLTFAEDVALKSGKLHKEDNYAILDSDEFRELFSKYSIAVGSTGNLGLSIGIMSARLGLRVTVHMSADAKQWKKDLLRSKGVNVVEYDGDFQLAVAEGRKLAEQDPFCHFIDDENSKTLFLGYTTVATRLQKQLEAEKVQVDADHPLFVYLPCGVGGSPGGVTYGLKKIYGENVHCIFAEPVQAPCMLLGVMTGLQDKISVQDVGLTGQTAADGLAIPRASKVVGKIVGNLLDGIYTVVDEKMERLLIDLYDKEKIFVEPSATAGFPGYTLTQTNSEYAARFGQKKLDAATHIVWATGGSMVPEEERQIYLHANV